MVFLSTQRAEDHYPELSQLGMSFSESSPFLFKFNPLTAMMSPGKMEMTPKSNIWNSKPLHFTLACERILIKRQFWK